MTSMISSGVTTSTNPELHGTSVRDPGMEAARASLTSASGLVLERRASDAVRLSRDATLLLAGASTLAGAETLAGTATLIESLSPARDLTDVFSAPAAGVREGGRATLFRDVIFLATPDADAATAQERRVALDAQAVKQFVATM